MLARVLTLLGLLAGPGLAQTLLEARFLDAETQGDRQAEMMKEAEHLDEEIAALEAEVPESWEEVHKVFAELTGAETKARMTYRRSADGSVEPVVEFLKVLDGNAAFAALEDRLMELEAKLPDGDRAELEEAVKALGSEFNAVAGANKVGSALSKVRRQLRDGKEDREKAAEEWAKAVEEYKAQATWRTAADGDLKAGLLAYRSALSETIGARQEESLSRDQALYLARCGASHRDISLNF